MKTLHVFTLATTACAFFDGQFEYLTRNGHEIHMVSCAGDVNDFCERNHVKFFPVEIPRRIDIKGDIKAIRQLVGIIQREKYDAVFGHTPKGALLAMVSAFIARTPIRVYYRHGLIYTTANGVKRFIFKSVERLTALLSNKIVNVSPSLSALAIKDRLNSNRKQCVLGAGTCGGIDATNLFNPAELKVTRAEFRKSMCIADTDFVIGFCGRICKEKGIRELINGFQQFRQTYPDVNPKLLLVGSLDERDILEPQYVNVIKTDADIIMTGKIEHSEIPAYYQAMDVFVLPSYREGFGMCVIEASAMEVPILVSKSHGCVDSIRENETGLYIEISADDIVRKLVRMQDAKLRHRLGSQGRRFVLANFDHGKMWPEILNLYNKILHK